MKRGLLLPLLLAASACGGGADEPVEGSASTAAPAPRASAPAELIGTYSVTLHESDIPANAPPELDELSWTLRIGNEGGPDGGPFLAIDSPEHGNLEAPSLRVAGGRLFLVQEECAAGDAGTQFYDNEYSWQLEGSVLRLTTVQNSCGDHVAETILTSRPWRKDQG